MDESEGRPNSYELAELPGVQFCIGRSKIVPLFAYVNVLHGVMIHEGKPVSLRARRQKRARSLLATTTEADAATWLDFGVLPYPDPPENFSQIL